MHATPFGGALRSQHSRAVPMDVRCLSSSAGAATLPAAASPRAALAVATLCARRGAAAPTACAAAPTSLCAPSAPESGTTSGGHLRRPGLLHRHVALCHRRSRNPPRVHRVLSVVGAAVRSQGGRAPGAQFAASTTASAAGRAASAHVCPAGEVSAHISSTRGGDGRACFMCTVSHTIRAPIRLKTHTHTHARCPPLLTPRTAAKERRPSPTRYLFYRARSLISIHAFGQ